ncbi:hypothetical protein CU254_25975 [Amycolatopsis sp. AA4]|uniref:hypothetical protein n=1 Tax=Streptomyces sp. AA4 TaxID=591158 RepID=UPI0001B545E6|nr:hypothetical protein [Streptomyces sp. AA4]ATY13491.1 hypothetical protein CU254_25975 [Amycolatopsis sp. AA4]
MIAEKAVAQRGPPGWPTATNPKPTGIAAAPRSRTNTTAATVRPARGAGHSGRGRASEDGILHVPAAPSIVFPASATALAPSAMAVPAAPITFWYRLSTAPEVKTPTTEPPTAPTAAPTTLPTPRNTVPTAAPIPAPAATDAPKPAAPDTTA